MEWVKGFAGVVIAVLLAGAARADPVTVTINGGFGGASSRTGGFAPFSLETLSAANADGSATIAVALDGNDILISGEHRWPVGGSVDSHVFLYFTVSEDTTYSISGSYSIDSGGVPAGGQFINEMFIDGLPIDGGTLIFADNWFRGPMADQTFTIGDPTVYPADQRRTVGSTTGTLLAGRQYVYWTEPFSGSSTGPAGEMTGTFDGRIRIGEAAAVPLPSAASAFVALMGAGLFGRRRRLG